MKGKKNRKYFYIFVRNQHLYKNMIVGKEDNLETNYVLVHSFTGIYNSFLFQIVNATINLLRKLKR